MDFKKQTETYEIKEEEDYVCAMQECINRASLFKKQVNKKKERKFYISILRSKIIKVHEFGIVN